MHLEMHRPVDCIVIGWWKNPPVATRKLLHADGVAEIQLVEMHDKMDKMGEVMVPISTSQVEPHTNGWFASVSV